MPVDVSLLERLSDPVLLAGPDGEVRWANRAFHELAGRLGVEPTLAALFGSPALAVLAEARRSGRGAAFLPLVASDDLNQGYRLTATADDRDDSLAVQLTDLSEEVAWRHQLFLRNSELTVLNDIGMALSGTLEMDVLARRIWEQTGRMMDNAHFYLALHDRDANTIQFPLWVEHGAVQPEKPARPFRNSVTEYLLLGHQPLLLNGDVTGQLRDMGLEPIGKPCVSFAGVPILSDGEALGVLALQDYDEAGRFGRHELGVLNIVATQASAAIRNARLFEATRRAYEELTAAQAQLMESERLKGVTETVGALNHEVNNPLATIVGTAQLLLRGDRIDAETRVKVQRVLDAAKRIQSVTGKMSSLIQANSRPYPGQVRILDLGGSLAKDDHRPSGVSSFFRFPLDAAVRASESHASATEAAPAKPEPAPPDAAAA